MAMNISGDQARDALATAKIMDVPAKKTAVVFGGAGFIGHHLIKSLLERGYREVISADIADPVHPVPGARYVICDVRQPIQADLTATPPDEVYNLAAIHRTPGHPDHEYFETNIAGAENVCRYCRDTGTARLIFTSSIAVYGPMEEAKDEASVPAPTTAYGQSKFEAEAIHRAWAKEDQARQLVILRPAVVFGPHENGNFTRLAQALKTRIFLYAGRRDTIKGCGYVGELVASMAFAIALKRNQFLYNFCYPEPYTIQDICETYHAAAGLPKPLGMAPLGLMLGVARGFELLAAVGLKTSINRPRVMKVVQSTHIVPNALAEAGYEFETDLAEGIRRWRAAEPAGVIL